MSDTTRIPLRNSDRSVLVDVVDASRLSAFAWRLGRSGYAIRNARSGEQAESIHVIMHRVITDAPRGLVVDHINGDKLDNRRANLRVCSHIENCHNHSAPTTNTSGRLGVDFHRASGRWRARIRISDRHIHLGYFDSFDDAVGARRKSEIEHWGEFAPSH